MQKLMQVEPQHLIANLGMSTNFGTVDTVDQPFPVHLAIDVRFQLHGRCCLLTVFQYIRVYQPKSAINIGCDPPDFPTSDYINT
jgi:hypothetical protein